MAFVAKFPGRCTNGDPIKPGDYIATDRGVRGYRHLKCPPKGGYQPAYAADVERSTPDDWDPQRDHDEAEYQKGLADGQRYQMEKKMYGPALAEQFAIEDDYVRYWKNGEDY